MKLTEDMFELLVGQTNLLVCGAQDERRATPRIPMRRKMTLVRRRGQVRETTTVRDLSLTGAGLLNPTEMSPGERLLLLFPLASRKQPYTVLYQVKRSVQTPAGWQVGVALTAVLARAAA